MVLSTVNEGGPKSITVLLKDLTPTGFTFFSNYDSNKGKQIEENNKVMERQENERRDYFKKIERNGNNFVSTNASYVLNDLKKNSKDEDDKMRKFMEEKEQR